MELRYAAQHEFRRLGEVGQAAQGGKLLCGDTHSRSEEETMPRLKAAFSLRAAAAFEASTGSGMDGCHPHMLLDLSHGMCERMINSLS